MAKATKPAPKAGSGHYVWDPPNAAVLQTGFQSYYLPGEVVPDAAATADELSDAAKASLKRVAGAKKPSDPHPSPWR